MAGSLHSRNLFFSLKAIGHLSSFCLDLSIIKAKPFNDSFIIYDQKKKKKEITHFVEVHYIHYEKNLLRLLLIPTSWIMLNSFRSNRAIKWFCVSTFQFLQITMIGWANPSLQLKLYCHVLIPDVGLSDHPLGPLVKKLPGPQASLTLVWPPLAAKLLYSVSSAT